MRSSTVTPTRPTTVAIQSILELHVRSVNMQGNCPFMLVQLASASTPQTNRPVCQLKPTWPPPRNPSTDVVPRLFPGTMFRLLGLNGDSGLLQAPMSLNSSQMVVSVVFHHLLPHPAPTGDVPPFVELR